MANCAKYLTAATVSVYFVQMLPPIGCEYESDRKLIITYCTFLNSRRWSILNDKYVQFQLWSCLPTICQKYHKTVLMKFLGEIVWCIQTKSPIPQSNQTENPSTSGFCLWCGWVPSTFTPASNNSAVVTGVYRFPLWSAVMKTQHPGGHTRDTGFLIHIHLSPFKQCSNIVQSVLV